MANNIFDEKITQIEQCYCINDNNGKIDWFHDKLGSFLINKLHIYSKDNNLYLFKNGIYVRNEFDLSRAIQFYNKNAKDNFRKEVVKYCEISAPQIETKENYNLIGCKNGVYDLKSESLLQYDCDMFLQHSVNAEYNINAKCDDVDKLLNKVSCNDKRIRMLIEEMIGYCLYRNCRYQKCFLLTGYGKNGKSTLLEMICNLIGNENVSALSLTDLQDKFKKAELQDKLVNINDDQSNERITDTADFKKIVTGGIMTMERKNQDPFKYKNYAKLIMSANEIPKSNDKSDGYYRRFILIPLNAVITKNDADFDPNIIEKVTTNEAMDYLFILALKSLKRIIVNGGFSENEVTNDEMTEYKEDNDPTIKFVNEYGILNIINKGTDRIYDEFNNWYEDEYNKKSQYNKTTVSRSFKNNFNIQTKVERINGKVVRTYIENETKNVTNNNVTHIEKIEDLPVIDEELPF